MENSVLGQFIPTETINKETILSILEPRKNEHILIPEFIPSNLSELLTNENSNVDVIHEFPLYHTILQGIVSIKNDQINKINRVEITNEYIASITEKINKLQPIRRNRKKTQLLYKHELKKILEITKADNNETCLFALWSILLNKIRFMTPLSMEMNLIRANKSIYPIDLPKEIEDTIDRIKKIEFNHQLISTKLTDNNLYEHPYSKNKYDSSVTLLPLYLYRKNSFKTMGIELSMLYPNTNVSKISSNKLNPFKRRKSVSKNKIINRWVKQWLFEQINNFSIPPLYGISRKRLLNYMSRIETLIRNLASATKEGGNVCVIIKKSKLEEDIPITEITQQILIDMGVYVECMEDQKHKFVYGKKAHNPFE